MKVISLIETIYNTSPRRLVTIKNHSMCMVRSLIMCRVGGQAVLFKIQTSLTESTKLKT